MLHSVFKHGSRSAWQIIQRRQCRLHTTHGEITKERKPDSDGSCMVARSPHFFYHFWHVLLETSAHWNYPIYTSERIPGCRSIYLAHVSTLPAPSALQAFIRHLRSFRALKRATSCMYAYRVTEIQPDLSRILLVGQRDGSEEGSGKRLSRLLQESECENIVVVVTRRHRGVKLGSGRWKLFSMVVKDALQRARAAAIAKEKAPETPTSHASHSRKRI